MKTFLESKLPALPPEECLFHIIPAPYEKIVAYAGGAGKGPAAILDASQLLETFDGTSCPSSYGIYTHKAQYGADFLERELSNVWKSNKIPVLLGGEQGVTLSAVKVLKKMGEEIGVVHFDARPNLQPVQESDVYHHASVMTHVLDMDYPLCQIGIRGGSLAEAELQKTGSALPTDFPDKVYLSIDVSVLDPSIMPATRTPEPDGLSWAELFQWLEKIVAEKTVIGFDVVELAPMKGLHAPDYLCARLIYNLMGLISRA